MRAAGLPWVVGGVSRFCVGHIGDAGIARGWLTIAMPVSSAVWCSVGARRRGVAYDDSVGICRNGSNSSGRIGSVCA